MMMATATRGAEAVPGDFEKGLTTVPVAVEVSGWGAHWCATAAFHHSSGWNPVCLLSRK